MACDHDGPLDLQRLSLTGRGEVPIGDGRAPLVQQLASPANLVFR